MQQRDECVPKSRVWSGNSEGVAKFDCVATSRLHTFLLFRGLSCAGRDYRLLGWKHVQIHHVFLDCLCTYVDRMRNKKKAKSAARVSKARGPLALVSVETVAR